MSFIWIVWCMIVGAGLSIIDINIIDTPVKFLVVDALILVMTYPFFYLIERAMR